MKKRSRNENSNMIKNKKVLLYVLIVVLILGAFAFGRDTGWKAGTADMYDAIYPPVDADTDPIYPPSDYIYPPVDADSVDIYPPMP